MSTGPSRKHRIAWLLLVAAALLALNVYLFRAYLLPPMPRRETPSPIVPEPEPPAPPPESEPKSPAPPVAEFPPLPPEPPPGSEIADGHPTPPVPEPSLPESSEPSIAIEPAPDQFLAVVDLLAKSAGLTQRRAVDVAIRGLEQWCAEQPSHPLLPWVNLELRGLRRLRAAIERLAASGGRAAGVPLDSTPGVAGEVIRILPNHQVSVIRRFGEGTGIVEVDLWRLGDADLDRLFHAANGENGPLDAAAWAIGQGQWRRAMELLARLAGEDAEFLRQWLEARQQVQREAAALRALEEARTLVQASRFREALATLRQARETVPEARVISWAAREAWNELERLAREEAERAPSSSEPPTASRRESPSAPDVGPAEAEEGETVFIRDLKQRPAAYHGKTVRLRFRTRGPIEELGEGRFKTTLTADDGIIEVEFPEEGWRWVNSLPEYFFDRGSPRYVYGVFDAENEVVRLIGRTRRIPMGGRSVEYTW